MSNAERHLRRPGYGKCIIKDSDFQRVRDALQSKWKELKSQGKGNKPKATTALSDEEFDIFYIKKVLGLSSPQALVNTVWLNNMLHFGLRGCKEQRELPWGAVYDICRLRTADRRPQTADRRLQTADHRLQTA